MTKGFEICLTNVQIIQIMLDFRLTILTSDDKDESLSIVIGCPFFVRANPSITDAMVDPEGTNIALGAVALILRHREFTKCDIAATGNLTLEFGSDLTIEVPSDEHYEAWDVDCGQFKLLAMPGGEVAFWDRSGHVEHNPQS